MPLLPFFSAGRLTFPLSLALAGISARDCTQLVATARRRKRVLNEFQRELDLLPNDA